MMIGIFSKAVNKKRKILGVAFSGSIAGGGIGAGIGLVTGGIDGALIGFGAGTVVGGAIQVDISMLEKAVSTER